jgi:hypothetical protein
MVRRILHLRLQLLKITVHKVAAELVVRTAAEVADVAAEGIKIKLNRIRYVTTKEN